MGNGWYISRTDGKVQVFRGTQQSADHRDLAPNHGDFAAAWLEHGTKPENAGYEYLVLLDFIPEKAEEIQKQLQTGKPYRILRQDSQVHAVQNHPSGVTAAIFFAPQPDLNWPLLRRVQEPSYVMYRQPDDLTLHLSLNTPDLAGFIHRDRNDLPKIRQDKKKEMQDRIVRLAIAGNWQLMEPVPGVTVNTRNGETHICGTFRHGIAKQLKLKKVQSD